MDGPPPTLPRLDWCEPLAASSELEVRRALGLLLVYEQERAVFVKDAAGRYVRINAAGARLLGGRTPAEVIGRSDAALWPGPLAHRTLLNDAAAREAPTALLYREVDPALGAQPACAWLTIKGRLDGWEQLPGQVCVFGVARLLRAPGNG